MDSLAVKEFQPMKPGERITKDLKAAGISDAEVGRRCDPPVSSQTIGRWIDGIDEVNDQTISDEQWRKFAYGLRQVGLIPESYRPLPPSKSRVDRSLVPLADLFTGKQLEALGKILAADEDARAALLLVVETLLKKK